jgi:hypothetical protein
MENQENSANTEVENPITADDIDMEDMEGLTYSDIYKVQPMRNRSLKILACVEYIKISPRGYSS